MPVSYPASAQAVTATSAGTLTQPTAPANYGWVVVSNVTPWIATIVTANGAESLQPFTQDMYVVPTGGNVNYSMSVPPSGSAAAPANQPIYLQSDWYIATSGAPEGTWPFSLTAQAVEAAISGAVTSTSPQTLLATVVSATTSTTVTLPLNTETLIIETQGLTASPAVTGVTTSNNYPVIQLRGALSTGTQTWVAFVEQAKDAQVTVSVAAGGGSTATWQVSADTAARFIGACTGSEGTANHLNPGALTSQVGGLDLSSLLRSLAVAPGGAGSVNTLVVGGVDATPTVQSLSVTAPGAAVPSEVLVVQAGSDGTNTHLLSTDSSARIQLAPVAADTNDADSTAVALTAANATSQFGPTGAVIARSFTLTVAVISYTLTASGILLVDIRAHTSTKKLASIAVALTGTAITAGEVINFSISGMIGGAKGIAIPATGGGAFDVGWGYSITTPSAIGGRVQAIVHCE